MQCNARTLIAQMSILRRRNTSQMHLWIESSTDRKKQSLAELPAANYRTHSPKKQFHCPLLQYSAVSKQRETDIHLLSHTQVWKWLAEAARCRDVTPRRMSPKEVHPYVLYIGPLQNRLLLLFSASKVSCYAAAQNWFRRYCKFHLTFSLQTAWLRIAA